MNTRSENVRQIIDRMRSEWVAARAFLRNLNRQTIAQADMHRQGHSFHICDWASVKMTTQQRTQLAAAGVLGLKCAGPYQITRKVSHNTFELTLPPGVRTHSFLLRPAWFLSTWHLKVFLMLLPPWKPFRRRLGSPLMHLTITTVPPPCDVGL